jgi:hypothetical protein
LVEPESPVLSILDETVKRTVVVELFPEPLHDGVNGALRSERRDSPDLLEELPRRDELGPFREEQVENLELHTGKPDGSGGSSNAGEGSYLVDVTQRDLDIRTEDPVILYSSLSKDYHTLFMAKGVRDPWDINVFRPKVHHARRDTKRGSPGPLSNGCGQRSVRIQYPERTRCLCMSQSHCPCQWTRLPACFRYRIYEQWTDDFLIQRPKVQCVRGDNALAVTQNRPYRVT